MPDEGINTTITFRLPDELHRELVKLGEASGLNKHKMARTLIVLSLESRTGRSGKEDSPDFELGIIEDAIGSLQAALIDLRLALGRGVGAILQDVSPKRSKDEIRQWVLERIITPSKETIPPGEESA